MPIPRDRKCCKAKPCPICQGTSWCFLLADGRAVWCGRVSGGTPTKGGWVHKLAGAAPATPRVSKPAAPVDRSGVARLGRTARRAITDEQLGKLASELKVGADALERLGAGWATWKEAEDAGTRCNHRGLWTFPMSQPVPAGPHPVVGVRVRTPDHKGKYSITNSDGDGLFIPSGLSPHCQLIAPEGPTSTAALLTAGFAAVGRPNNRAGAAYLRQMCLRLRPTRLVILGDNDPKPPTEQFPLGRWPGREGAEAVAAALASTCADVRVVLPPAEVKDARDWLARDGPNALRVGLARAIEAAERVALARAG